MKSQGNIGLVFSLIILLLLGQGIFSLIYLNTITTQTENLYKHPYTVSNAARNIKINLVSMHHYMKQIALSENEQQLSKASSLVNVHEKQILENFNLIFDLYLGNRSDILAAYTSFIDWKAIRDEIIFLKNSGKNKAAEDFIKKVGANHVYLLNQETQKLIDFSDSMAERFLNKAIQARAQAYAVITALLITTVIVSIFISFYAVKRLNTAQSDMKNRINLIDQNILIATFDTNAAILEISAHLCRYLRVTRSEIIGERPNFFINDDYGDVQSEAILKAVSTGKTWEGEIRRVDSDGKAQWIHSTVHPEFDNHNILTGYTNIITDITDQELSITDTLTGLHNRRHFDNVINKEIRIANRNNTSLTLAVVDIDYFKKYNDHYGHPAGDRALIKVAQALKQSLRRPNDYVFRLGGEEFGVILSGLGPEQAFQFLEAIRSSIEKLEIEHSQSAVCQFVTISLGAYTNTGPNVLDTNHLYVKADEALYQAKVIRNHIVVS